MKYYGGIDGGSTYTTISIMNECGELVVTLQREGSNLYNIGIFKAVQLFHKMVLEAKQIAKIDKVKTLSSLGLCLSGAETEKIKKELLIEYKSQFPGDYEEIKISNDLVGSGISCVGSKGTVLVIIAGTGSNSGLISNSVLKTTCGGNGHLLGEAGSSYWIASTALKAIIRKIDHYKNKYSSYSLEVIENAARDVFDFKTKSDLIDIVYTDFSSDKIAKFSKVIGQLAQEGDMFSVQIIKRIGTHLAKHLLGNLSQIEELTDKQLNILCIGSVWNDWNMFKENFLNELSIYIKGYKLNMYKLKVSPSLGAIFFACTDEIPYDISQNSLMFFQIII